MRSTVANERQSGQAPRTPAVARYQVAKEAGWALRATAPMQKHLRPMLGDVNKATVSRMCAGEKGSPVSRFYELVRAVVLEGRTDAGSLIAGAMLVAEEAALTLPSQEIRRRLMEAMAQECIAQSAEDIAQHALAVALGENAPNLRAALEGYDVAVRHETAKHVDALVYARALMVIRGWRARP